MNHSWLEGGGGAPGGEERGELIPDSKWPADYQVSGGEGRGRGKIINPWFPFIDENSREITSTIVRLLMKAQDKEEDGASVAGP